MMRQRRLLVFAMSATTLAACYRNAPPAASPSNVVTPDARSGYAGVISDPLGFLPIDAELVVHLDAHELRASAVWQRFEPMVLAKVGATLDQFRAMCGFDPMSAIRRISIGMRDLEAPTPTGVIVVRGLDRTASMACLQKGLANQTPVTIDRDVVTVQGAAGEPPTVFTFVDATTIVSVIGPGSSAASLRLALDAGAPLRGSQAFTELFGGVQTADSLWFVLNGNAKALDKMASLGMKPRAIMGSVKVSAGVTATMRIRLETPDQAAQIASMAQSQLGSLSGFVDTLDVLGEDSDVVVRVVMTQDQLQSIATLVGGMAGAP